VRNLTEAFIRASGGGLLLPRMAVVGDLDLDETLGALLDPLGGGPWRRRPATRCCACCAWQKSCAKNWPRRASCGARRGCCARRAAWRSRWTGWRPRK
jgi:hypothetical protein